jgi:two-component sensor histidine kinase/integral membrane sensor domain MASE1
MTAENAFPLDQSPSGVFPLQPGPRKRRRVPSWQVLLGYWVAFFLFHLLANLLASPEGIYLWFYPAALSVGLLLIQGWRVWPAVVLAPLPLGLYSPPSGSGPFTVLAFALAYAGGYTLAVLAFRRAHLSPRLRRVQDLVGLLAMSFLGPLLAILPGLGLMQFVGRLPGGNFPVALRTLLLAHILGILTLLPVLMIWVRPMLALGTLRVLGQIPHRIRPWERGLQGMAIALTIAVVLRFSDPGTLHLKYLLFLPLAWIALRGGLQSASLGIPFLGLLMSLALLVPRHHPQAVVGMQSFLIILYCMTLLLAATVDARDGALRVGSLRHRRLTQLAACTGAIPWGMDLATGESGFMGDQAQALLGRPPEDWNAKPFWAGVVHPQDQLAFLRFLMALSRPGGTSQVEFRLCHSGGEEHWVRAVGGLEPTVSPTWIMGFLFDIQAHKRAEEDALRASLQEKDLLLKEIQHRVKNNLQVVSSLLRLQAATSPEPAVQRVLKEAQDRVQAIALVHQRLKHAPDFTQVDLPEYVQTLTERLVKSYATVPTLVDLRVQVEVTEVGPDVPVPLGLILNELVANALQHAFTPGEGGTISILLDHDERGWIRLRVADSGRGLPEGVTLDKGGLGFQLVRALTDQLGGTLVLEQRQGASFLLSFPPANPSS